MENTMPTKKTKARFKTNDVVVHTEQKIMMMVQDRVWMKDKNAWLYTLKTVTNNTPEWKRYYEEKLSDKCDKVKNSTAIKVLYGKPKTN